MTTDTGQAAAYVFLSYASADRERALDIARRLETSGISVWIDRKSIAGGSSWSAEIVRGIRGCRVFLVACSPAAMRSPNVQQEIQVAFESHHPILPLLLERAEMPESIVYALAGRQWIEVLAEPEGHWLPEAIRVLEGLNVRPSPATPISSVPGPGSPALPPPDEPSPVRNNLPNEVTSFVGREVELEEVGARLRTTRLLTLTGTGGCGKTRLALKVAEAVLDEFADGAWLVELAPLTNPSLVAPAVAKAIGVYEVPGRDLVTVLVDALRGRQLLIVLDNCEHLLDACAHLVDAFLRGCPHVRVLATSREALGIAGEVSRRIPSLQVPADQPVSLERLIQTEAVRLFVERARGVQPAFSVTEHNASAVAQLCRRLDGIPLAIELAAARLRAFSAEQISSRLDQRFRLLTGGSRAALPRQQTLAALVAWSYDLLNEPQRVLFDRLTVFAGGWTLEAAEAVCAGDPVASEDVLDLLAQLVDKSLVLMEPAGADSEVRYQLLETLRQYGQERLLARGEATVLRGRHLAWYLSVGERAEVDLRGTDLPSWLDRLEVEHDNLRAALAWSQDPSAAASAIETSQGPIAAADAGLRLAAGIELFWFLRVHRREAFRWLNEGLAPNLNVPVATRARALLAAGILGLIGGAGGERAQAFLEESLDLFQQLDDKQGLANTMAFLGYVAGWRHDLARARALGQESLARARESGSDKVLGLVLNLSVAFAGVLGDEERQSMADESLVLAQKTGDILGIAMSNRILGGVALRRGEYDRARRCFAEDLTRTRMLRDTFGVVGGLFNVGDMASLTGDYAEAGRCYDEARRLTSDVGFSGDTLEADALWRVARLAMLDDEAAQPTELLQRALAIYQAADHRPGAGRCLAGLAAVANRQGDPNRAAHLLAASSSLRDDTEAPWERAEVERLTEAERQQLPAAAFGAAWDEGRAMTFEQAIVYGQQETAGELTPRRPSLTGE